MLNRILKGIKNPKLIYKHILFTLSPVLPDKFYLEQLFPIYTGYKLNLKNPQTYNEKLQWLKLYYRNPLYPKLVDKYEYKNYIQEKYGGKYVVENYGVWSKFEDIDFDKLPNQFVLKTTHDQGGVVICRDKGNFDYENARKKLTKHLKNRKQAIQLREWAYAEVKPRIIAEEYLDENYLGELIDYKFHCFNGEPRYLFMSSGRFGEETYFDFYDINFNRLNVSRPNTINFNGLRERPSNYNLMLQFAREIANGHPHVRVDFFNVDGKVLFGEFTLFTGSGLKPFIPEKWDYEFGKHLDLPEKNN